MINDIQIKIWADIATILRFRIRMELSLLCNFNSDEHLSNMDLQKPKLNIRSISQGRKIRILSFYVIKNAL